MSFDTPPPVYIGYGNVITVLPYADIEAGERLDMTDTDKVEVCVGGVSADSDGEPDAISWEDDPDDGWVIRFKLGLISGIEEGEAKLRIVVYDPDYPNGLVLTHDLCVEIIGDC